MKFKVGEKLTNVSDVNIQYRAANKSDITFLLTLRKQTMQQHLINAGLNSSEEQHLERIYDHFEDSFIIMLHDQPIGLLKVGRFAHGLHIRQLQLVPECQRQGIGRKVIEQMQHKATKMGLAITLNVLLKNPAKSLYERVGFKVVGQNQWEFQMRWSATDFY